MKASSAGTLLEPSHSQSQQARREGITFIFCPRVFSHLCLPVGGMAACLRSLRLGVPPLVPGGAAGGGVQLGRGTRQPRRGQVGLAGQV